MAPIPVGKIVLGAVLVPWWNRTAFLRALWIPVTTLAGLSLGLYYGAPPLPEAVHWAGFALYWALFALFAVTCHRLVLLDPAEVARRMVPRVTRRELRFMLLAVAIWAIGIVAGMALGTVAVNAVRGGSEAFDDYVLYLVWAPFLYVSARLSPVLPATAVDRTVNLRWAWNLTQGNTLRMMLVVGGVPWLTAEMARWIYRSDATIVETVAVVIFATVLFVVEIAAISLAYRELTQSSAAAD